MGRLVGIERRSRVGRPQRDQNAPTPAPVLIRAELANDLALGIEHRFDRMRVTARKRCTAINHNPWLAIIRQARDRTAWRHKLNLMRTHRCIFVLAETRARGSSTFDRWVECAI